MMENMLRDPSGRKFIIHILSECGVYIGEGFSFRPEKTAHEVGLDLLQDIMYNYTDELKKLISDDKNLKELLNGRGNNNNE